MPWFDVDYAHLQMAMRVIEDAGVEEARRLYNREHLGRRGGFTRANTTHVYDFDRGPFEHRVLIAIAHAIQFPERPRLKPKDFDNTDYRVFFAKINSENTDGEAAFGYRSVTDVLPRPNQNAA